MTITAIDRRDLEFQLLEVLGDSLLVRSRQSDAVLEDVFAAADRMASQPLARGFSMVMTEYRDYVTDLAWATEHFQPTGAQDSETEQDLEPMIAQADVRRQLLSRKAGCEGGLALCLYGAELLTRKNEHPDASEREHAEKLFALLAPVISGWPAQKAAANREAAQRARASALDLLGRQVWKDQSHGLQLLIQRMQVDLQAAISDPCQQWALSLSETLQQAVRVTQSLGKSLMGGGSESVLANAQGYLRLFGHIMVAWMWLRQANVAASALASASSDPERHFYQGKLQAAQYFFHWELPTVAQDLVLLRNQDDTCLNMQPDWF